MAPSDQRRQQVKSSFFDAPPQARPLAAREHPHHAVEFQGQRISQVYVSPFPARERERGNQVVEIADDLRRLDNPQGYQQSRLYVIHRLVIQLPHALSQQGFLDRHDLAQ